MLWKRTDKDNRKLKTRESHLMSAEPRKLKKKKHFETGFGVRHAYQQCSNRRGATSWGA